MTVYRCLACRSRGRATICLRMSYLCSCCSLVVQYSTLVLLELSTTNKFLSVTEHCIGVLLDRCLTFTEMGQVWRWPPAVQANTSLVFALLMLFIAQLAHSGVTSASAARKNVLFIAMDGERDSVKFLSIELSTCWSTQRPYVQL